MIKFMRRIPGGMLLVPMFISALIYTFAPETFYIGGLSQALFTREGLNYVLAAAIFFSGATIDLRTLSQVIKKQGVLILVKTALSIGLGMLFIKTFGIEGVFGISAVAFVCAITSANPSLYLALIESYGEERDQAAFGLVGLITIPAYPIFVYGISQGGQMDWMPIISALIPLILGIILGNLDEDWRKLLGPGVPATIPLMGWAFGTSINLLDAGRAGFQGILLTAIYYLIMPTVLILFSRLVLKDSGVPAMAMSSIAGMSASVPFILAQTMPELEAVAPAATAQLVLGVVISSILTPILVKKLAGKNKISKTQA